MTGSNISWRGLFSAILGAREPRTVWGLVGGVGRAAGRPVCTPPTTHLRGNPGDVELLVDNIHVNGGRSGLRDLRSLIPVSLLGIGAGSAIGPEAPLVQDTGSVGRRV